MAGAGGGRRMSIVVSSVTGFSGTFSGWGPRIKESRMRKKCLIHKKECLSKCFMTKYVPCQTDLIK